MPDLRGIIHAAGILDDRTLMRQDWESFASVLAPKAVGAWNLHRLTKDQPLDFFILFSSAVSVLGSPGQSNYAAANAAMDALAHQRRIEGLTALSINWGPWAEVGMAARLRKSGQQSSAQGLLDEISPEQALALLERLMSAETAQVVALSTEWARFKDYLPSASLPRILSELLQESQPQREREQSPVKPNEFLREIRAATPGQGRELLFKQIQREIIDTLGLDASQPLDRKQRLFDLGMDSLMAIELRTRLQKFCGHSLPTTMAFDYPTIGAMVDYLADEVLKLEPVAALRKQSQGEERASAATLERLENLTDEEAEAVLLEKLASLEERMLK